MTELKRTLELAIASDIVIANGIVYHIERVDCDEQVIYCRDGKWPCCIDLYMLSRSQKAEFFTKTELKE